MPAILCKCGNRLGLGEIPNPIEMLCISDSDFDALDTTVNTNDVYEKMIHFLKCNQCERLWFFWDGFDKVAKCYFPE